MLHVSGVDLVDGTPVLDVKPYVGQYDSVGWTAESNTDEAGGVRQPAWIREGLALRRTVVFDPGVLELLGEKEFRKQKFCRTAERLEAVVREVLGADVRSRWHTAKARKGGSKAPVVDKEGKRKEDGVTARENSTQQLDRFLVEFVVVEVEEVGEGGGDRGGREEGEEGEEGGKAGEPEGRSAASDLVKGMAAGSGARDIVTVKNITLVV